MSKQYYVYIMGNERPTLYIGMTDDLLRRVKEHKDGLIDGFTKKYKLHKLLYFETCSDVRVIIEREKQLKRWHRQWKLNLIKEENPGLKDLYASLIT